MTNHTETSIKCRKKLFQNIHTKNSKLTTVVEESNNISVYTRKQDDNLNDRGETLSHSCFFPFKF